MAAEYEGIPSLGDSFQMLCPMCRYDLRAQREQDPVRCPECGWSSPKSDLLVSQVKYKQALATLAALPGLCVVAETAIVIAVFGIMSVWGGRRVATPLLIFGTVGLFGALGIWFYVRRFRKSCRNRPGWQACLLWGHLRFVVTVCIMLGGCGVAMSASAIALKRSSWAPAVMFLSMFGWFGVFAFLVHRIGGTEGLMGIQARHFLHDAAVEMAWLDKLNNRLW